MFSFITAEKYRLLLQAAIVVAAARLALWFLPFRWLCARVDARRLSSPRPGDVTAGRWTWAVQAAARRIPGASCLTQALALQWLLAREGHSTSISVGVAKDGVAGFEAHAWVESGGQILIGGNEPLDRYMPILRLPAETP